jgi:hypothetical protein
MVHGFLDFIVIGAQKSGTTTLHAWLVGDGRIDLPERKETHYFSSTERHGFGWRWYAECFGSGGIIRGEVDPDYLSSAIAPGLIRKEVGDVKIAVVLRNPVERARSQYRMSVRRGQENRTLEEASLAEVCALRDGTPIPDWCDYVSRGLYAKHLSRYEEHFSDLHLVLYEDLFNDADGGRAYVDLLRFLGLDAGGRMPNIDLKANPSAVARNAMVTRLLWNREYAPALRRTARTLLPSGQLRYKVATKLDRWNRVPLENDPNDPPAELAAIALEWIKEDVELLRSRFGVNVERWR